MISKKGSVELLIFLAVALTALGGVIFLLLPNSTTGKNVAFQDQQGAVLDQYVPSSINVPVKSDSLTGNFVIPAAKQYGGGISGVSAPGTKAFPAGRAFEQDLPDQSCYTCSCIEQGITSATREAAETVCTNNCGGDIVSIVIGECQ